MGNNNSNNNQINAVDPLTSNPQYQDAYRNLYSNTSDIPVYPGAYAAGDLANLGPRKQPKLEVKKTVAIQNDFSIDKTSITLVPTQNSGHYTLKFKFRAQTEVIITIFYCGREIVDDFNNTAYVFIDEKYPPVKSYIFNSGDSQDFPIDASVMDTKNYSDDLMTSYTVDRFPLIIKMETKAGDPDALVKKFYNYCTFTKTKAGFTGKVLKQKLEINNKSFVLDDVFGIGSSNLKDPNAPEAKDCAICLTSKIDTLVLPCKHMCLCFDCAQNLRVSSSNRCPLCRNVVESFVKLENSLAQK